jgi:hypothetical protein
VVIQRLAKDLDLAPDQADVSNFRSLTEYYQLAKNGELSSFYTWMDQAFHPAHIDIRQSVIHKRIIDLDFPIVYTTNYDRWIERAFEAHGKPYRKIVNVSDWTSCLPHQTEVIKFHGDFDDFSSIVLTESSFFSRMVFEKPLDIRLRSDSLARPFLFIGYSLRDPNIRFLLYRLSEVWEKHATRDQQPRSYILMSEPDPIQERILRERGVEPILSERQDHSSGLTHFLDCLARECDRD